MQHHYYNSVSSMHYTTVCRYLASGSGGDSSTHGEGVDDPPHSATSSTTSTVTGEEEDIPPLPLPHPRLSAQTQVITPLYSLTSSSPSLSSGSERAQRNPAPCVGEFGSPGERGLRDRKEKWSHKTGKPRRKGRTSSPKHLSEEGYDIEFNYHHHYPLKSSPSYSSVDAKSTVTTSSEIDFRNNLASLDADIARLQMQFQVARQPQ